jgi:hypothetical protein
MATRSRKRTKRQRSGGAHRPSGPRGAAQPTIRTRHGLVSELRETLTLVGTAGVISRPSRIRTCWDDRQTASHVVGARASLSGMTAVEAVFEVAQGEGREIRRSACRWAWIVRLCPDQEPMAISDAQAIRAMPPTSGNVHAAGIAAVPLLLRTGSSGCSSCWTSRMAARSTRATSKRRPVREPGRHRNPAVPSAHRSRCAHGRDLVGRRAADRRLTGRWRARSPRTRGRDVRSRAELASLVGTSFTRPHRRRPVAPSGRVRRYVRRRPAPPPVGTPDRA